MWNWQTHDHPKIPDGAQLVVTFDCAHHKRGEILRLNHDKHPESLWVATSDGKASIIDRRDCRLATPDDPGYQATHDFWCDHKGIVMKGKWLWFSIFVNVYLFITIFMMSKDYL